MLTSLIRVVIEEAERNPDFESRIRDALGNIGKATSEASKTSKGESLNQELSGVGASNISGGRRASNRRPQALLDPVRFAREGEQVLRAELSKLNLGQLLDIVADYGMDPGKLVMKWKAPDRVIERIVEVSLSRAHKGDAFRTKANADNVQEHSSSSKESD
jgi:hypothetical protein